MTDLAHPPAPPLPRGPTPPAPTAAEPLAALGLTVIGVLCLAAATMLGWIVSRGVLAFVPLPILEVRTDDGRTRLVQPLGTFARGAEAGPGQSVLRCLHRGFDDTRSETLDIPTDRIAARTVPADALHLATDDGEWLVGLPAAWVDRDVAEPADGPELLRRFREKIGAVKAQTAEIEAALRHLAAGPARALELAQSALRRGEEELELRRRELYLEKIRRLRKSDAAGDPTGERMRSRTEAVAESEARVSALRAACLGPAAELESQLAEAWADRGRRFPDAGRYALELVDPSGARRRIPLDSLRTAYAPNRLGWGETAGIALRSWFDLPAGPGNLGQSRDGLAAAVWGAAALAVLCLAFVVPTGTAAAIYLHEYGGRHPLARQLRFAVANLSGVPGVVWGVFGLIFFCNTVGVGLDDLFFAERKRWEHRATLGGPCLLWAALTLSWMMLPNVIVSVERTLAAIPWSVREASWACGAGRRQTICRIVLPAALPGIGAAALHAMARGLGQFAPLILVGGARWVTQLPFDGTAPYLHPEQSFMHPGLLVLNPPIAGTDPEGIRSIVEITMFLWILAIVSLQFAAYALERLQPAGQAPESR